ncbi:MULTISPECIES: hypothetical protein [Pseudomonas]|uniref:Uncharacterized protein n=1 Tax=Pseudomonas sessilinigenes TaxID=658629 RepID=A0ABX8MVF6_9PSED|nr:MULTISPECIES: hypothetical protein [Pseudomonas]AZC24261.1 hypothetical protein C4K39_2587 [Pseudomonas sessilinigenes]QIH08565.1 hypothetical protein ATY02_18470 [Pseudomonas sp. BIOMIG1BAC]QXH43214.1 hypothetical protein KSS89_13655 [Pseudomonas sessilinigenes]UMZ14527.1 hypothetical protein I9018_12895 [Pseudomonas sp. MPFS]
MNKTSRFKRLGRLLLVSLVLNSLSQILLALPAAIALVGAVPHYAWSLLVTTGVKILLLTPLTAVIPGLLMLFGLRFGAWACLPMCILLMILGPWPGTSIGQFLLGYWIIALLGRFAWLKGRDLYYYARAKS